MTTQVIGANPKWFEGHDLSYTGNSSLKPRYPNIYAGSNPGLFPIRTLWIICGTMNKLWIMINH